MPKGIYVRKHPTPRAIPKEKIALIRADLAAGGITQTAIAARYKVHVSTVNRIGHGVAHPSNAGMGHHQGSVIPSEIRQKVIDDWKSGQTTRMKIAIKYDIAKSTVDRFIAEAIKAEANPAPLLPPAISVASMTLPEEPQRPGPKGKYGHLGEQMKTLHDQGYSHREIATKLGMINPGGTAAISTVGYYLNARGKRGVKSTTEGAQSNGHETLDSRFLVGFGCAELERTLTTIAQRLGIAPNLLRQGFSRFLGSTAVR